MLNIWDTVYLVSPLNEIGEEGEKKTEREEEEILRGRGKPMTFFERCSGKENRVRHRWKWDDRLERVEG